MAKKRIKSQMPIDTGEWLNNPRINTLSYELRGIWLTMLCYMWDSPTRGVMAYSNGKIYTKTQILRMLEIDALSLQQLIESGLLAIDENGAYHSPDMVRQEQISQIRRSAGRKGGEITKSKAITPKEPQSASIEPMPPIIVEPPPKAQEPDTAPGLFGDDELPTPPPELTPQQKEKDEKAKKHKYGEFVTMTRDEYAKLCEKYGEDATRDMIEILDNYIGSKGKRYKSHYRTILSWVADSYYEKQQRYGRTTPTTAQPRGGTGTVATNATGTVPTEKRASLQPCDAAEKDYTERF